MPLPHTSKDKSARLDWGYHARRSGFVRWRRRLWLVAAVLSVPLVGAAVLAAATGRPPQSLAVAASRGPLAHPHSAWDNQCEACHTPFQPINSAGWFDRLTGRTPHPQDRNLRCEQCHAAPAHHPAQKPAEVVGCADCHHDHQGSDHNLNRLADATCTACHADLAAHHTGTPRVEGKVNGFATSHPEFRNNPTDSTEPFRRTLRFAHAIHLTASPMMDKQLAEMTEADRTRYTPVVDAMRAGNKAAVCSSCHQFDANRPDGAASPPSPVEAFSRLTRDALGNVPLEAILPARAAGTAPLPITFEAHCQACHPLTFDNSDGLKSVAAPHRVQPDALERFLRQAYTERLVAAGLTGGAAPDRGPGRLDPPPALVGEVRGKIGERVAGAKAVLSGGGGCGKCHTPDSAGGYLRTNTPASWQPRARFDHTSHRLLDCQSCHPAAFGLDPGGERYQWPPDLPGINDCRSCHSPAGGVAHGCTDCHAYHHADRRLQGRGAAAKAPASPFADISRAKDGRPGGK